MKAALKGFSQYVQNKLLQISKIHTSYYFSIKKEKKYFPADPKIFKIVVQGHLTNKPYAKSTAIRTPMDIMGIPGSTCINQY
jgi:hypothetical protein